jgi:hypothetical protein
MAYQAKSVRIGDHLVIGKGKQQESVKIKRLHEVCVERPGPHVHIVHQKGSLCAGFRQYVNVHR